MAEKTGAFIKRGAKSPALPRDVKWQFTPTVKVGDVVEYGDIIGTVPETPLVEHKIMVPLGISGKIKQIEAGEYTIEEKVAVVEKDGKTRELTLMQEWPVRKPRPYLKRQNPSGLLTTGMRILD